MRRKNLMMQLFGIAFLCLSVTPTGFASRKEELERAAELAVERAAERVAERAVEKALETGNSTSETETIRLSHSSERKYDSTQQLPGFVYTPTTRKEYERIAKEKEAGELAVAQIMRDRLFKRAIVDENYKYRKSHERQDNGNLFSHGVSAQDEQTGVNQHETSIKSLMHPVTVTELNEYYPVISYQKIPIEQMTLPQGKITDTHQSENPTKSVIYHPVKLFRVSQPISTIHFYHRPPVPQLIRPFYYYQPDTKILKNTDDQASIH